MVDPYSEPLLSPKVGHAKVSDVHEEGLPITVHQTRHRKKWIACVVASLLLALTIGVAVPLVAQSLMRRYLGEAVVTVVEMEVLNIDAGVATVRLEGHMVIDAPFEASGEVLPTPVQLLISDPADRSKLGVVGTVQFPYMQVEGLSLHLNLTSDMTITDERLFHAFLSDVLANVTVSVFLDGVFTVSAFVPLYERITATERVFQPVTLRGTGGMGITLLGMDYHSSTTDTLGFYFNISVANPSQFYASIPLTVYSTDLPIYYSGCRPNENVFIGYLYPDELFLGKGDSFNRALGILMRDDNSNDCIALMLSNHMLGKNVLLTVNGTLKVDIGLPRNDDDPAIVSIAWDMPGVSEELIKDVFVPLQNVSAGRDVEIVGDGLLFNALTFDFTVDGLSFDVWVHEENFTADFVDAVFVPPVPFIARKDACLALEMTVSYQHALKMIALQAQDNLYLSALNATLRASVEAFAIAIPFEYGPISGSVGKCSTDGDPDRPTLPIPSAL